MGTATGIQWTDSTWNPVRGCSRVSPGCENCYAERIAGRFSGLGLPYESFATQGPSGGRWTRKVSLLPEHLPDPLLWKEPRRVFVNSMSDLFHESLPFEEIASVFGVMALCPQHQFQVLTKRAARMREFFRWAEGFHSPPYVVMLCMLEKRGIRREGGSWHWPLPNVWLGVSVEDQARADERVPILLETPGAVRFVSAEPLLEAVSLAKVLRHLDWIIVGGESGPGARAFDAAWARQIVRECARSGTACFVKQMGKRLVHDSDGPTFAMLRLQAHKGDRPEEWPEDLRVRQFPGAAQAKS